MVPLLETQRLRLRPYRRADLDALHRFWLVADAHLRLEDAVVSRDWMVQELARNAASFEQYGVGQWAVCRKHDHLLIGFCGFRFFDETEEVQLLFSFGRTHWSETLVLEATRAMIAFGFRERGFDQIIACADPPNHAAIRLLEHVQMRYRDRAIVNGYDALYYALDRTAWREDGRPYRRVA